MSPSIAWTCLLIGGIAMAAQTYVVFGWKPDGWIYYIAGWVVSSISCFAWMTAANSFGDDEVALYGFAGIWDVAIAATWLILPVLFFKADLDNIKITGLVMMLVGVLVLNHDKLTPLAKSGAVVALKAFDFVTGTAEGSDLSLGVPMYDAGKPSVSFHMRGQYEVERATYYCGLGGEITFLENNHNDGRGDHSNYSIIGAGPNFSIGKRFRVLGGTLSPNLNFSPFYVGHMQIQARRNLTDSVYATGIDVDRGALGVKYSTDGFVFSVERGRYRGDISSDYYMVSAGLKIQIQR